MTRAALFALLVGAAAFAAPVPPPGEREKIEKVWGKVFAPSEKYGFKLDGRYLVIRTAGEPILRPSPGKPPTTPRTHRTVTGDFVATVRVMGATAPNPKAPYEDGAPATRAGILVTGGGQEANLHLRQHHALDGNRRPLAQPLQDLWCYTWDEGNGRGRPFGAADLTKPLYLRVVRTEKVVSVAYSSDGKDWTDQPLPTKLEFPDEVTVGVYFMHSTHQIAEATFDGFTVEKPTPAK